MSDKTQKLLENAVHRLNEVLPPGQMLSTDPATILLGEGSPLDSMGFVNFLVAVEEELESQFAVKIILADRIATGDGVQTMADMQRILDDLVPKDIR